MAVSGIQHGRIQDGCHHQVESEWMSGVFFLQNGWIQDDRIQDGSHHQINQIELAWVRVEWECFWVNLREDNKVSESKVAVSKSNMAESESNMAEFKMAAIIKLSQNEWVKFFCAKWLNPRWLSSSSWVTMNEWGFFSSKWLNPRWQNSRWLPSSSWERMNDWSFLCANGGNQSWQVWVSLRGNTKMAESKMAKFKMAAIIMLSENEWVKVFFVQNG